jgi:hypothetical protein
MMGPAYIEGDQRLYGGAINPNNTTTAAAVANGPLSDSYQDSMVNGRIPKSDLALNTASLASSTGPEAPRLDNIGGPFDGDTDAASSARGPRTVKDNSIMKPDDGNQMGPIEINIEVQKSARGSKK